MNYKLWLDDLAKDANHPEKHAPESFICATSYEEACAIIIAYGPPTFMDLDHDLGHGPNGLDFLKWLENYCWLNNKDWWENPPRCYFHSENIETTKNMKSFMLSWKKAATEKSEQNAKQINFFG